MRLPNAMFLEHYVFFAYRRQPDETALDRRFLDPGRGRHLFPRGDTAPCDPTGLFPTHPDARSVARRRVDRKSGVEGKSVSVRVDLGGRSIIKTKTNNTN